MTQRSRHNDANKSARRYVVYRHFDAAGQLLYVGMSGSALQRTWKHQVSSPWFNQVVRIDVEHFGSLKLARGAERVAIRTEKPLHNVADQRTPDLALVAQLNGLPRRAGRYRRPKPLLVRIDDDQHG